MLYFSGILSLTFFTGPPASRSSVTGSERTVEIYTLFFPTTEPGEGGERLRLREYRPSESVPPCEVGPGLWFSFVPIGANVTVALARGLPSRVTFPETEATRYDFPQPHRITSASRTQMRELISEFLTHEE